MGMSPSEAAAFALGFFLCLDLLSRKRLYRIQRCELLQELAGSLTSHHHQSNTKDIWEKKKAWQPLIVLGNRCRSFYVKA